MHCVKNLFYNSALSNLILHTFYMSSYSYNKVSETGKRCMECVCSIWCRADIFVFYLGLFVSLLPFCIIFCKKETNFDSEKVSLATIIISAILEYLDSDFI